ncbi:amidase signature enzyme [Lecanosticta acicola]|uniref:Amidase signature enzyme n=1 Tax=Lecanosticta acicola TaxID=111012 RepID=A0AAI8W140_9PEZI|nr:amidase signature enzyme [Lecanosticta acicola]
MSTSRRKEVFVNRPKAKATEIPWQEPPAATNPVVKGYALHLGAIAISNLHFVQSLLWGNAGFNGLRNRVELEGFAPRYDPTVMKVDGDVVSSSKQTTDDEGEEGGYGVQKKLLEEAWEGKRPTSTAQVSVLDYTEAYRSGQLTPTAVAQALLPLIRKDATRHSVAFLQVREDLVLQAAEESTKRYRAGRPLSPLDGVPVAVKDEVDVAGYRKCFASRLDFTRKDDATSFCVRKWQEAGAVLMGKTIMHELGIDTTNNNPIFGTPRNPNNDQYYTGGSSGGSAYACAAGLMPLVQGNDGGGSIRIPANYCGLYGLKTSHGRVSSSPSLNLARSTGVCGPMAANMVDLEIGYRIMAQPDGEDADSKLFQAPGSIPPPDRKKILGIYRPWFDRADPVVKEACQKTLDHLTSKLGYATVDITLPLLHDAQMAHAMTILTELNTGLDPKDTHKLSAPTKVLVSVGRQTTSVDFLQAQRLRELLMQHLAYLYEKHPGLIIVTPTTPNAGWRIERGDLSHGLTNGNMQVRNMEYVYLANFTGNPAITLPCGYTDPLPGTSSPGRIPLGLMGMGDWCGEDDLLAFGYDCESYLGSSRERPGNWVDVLELAGAAGAGVDVDADGGGADGQ